MGKVCLSIKYGNKVDDFTPLLIKGLSFPCIIGMDLIKQLNLTTDKSQLQLNGQTLARLPQSSYLCSPLTTTTIAPAQETYIEISNPYIDNAEITSLLIDTMHNSDTPNLIINSSITHNDTSTISAIVTNIGNSDIHLDTDDQICNISPFNTTTCINNIHFAQTTEEIERCRMFQEARRKKYYSTNVIIDTTYGKNLTQTQKQELSSIINENKLAFSANATDLGEIFFYKLGLPLLQDSDVAFEQPRPIPYHIEPKVHEQITSWIANDMIEPTSSPFNVPLLVVKKPDGSIRTSLDARRLNKILKDDHHPLPNLRECLHRMGRTITKGTDLYITKLDLSKGFWQLPVLEADQEKVSFCHRNTQYKCKRSLYGVKVTPSGFARVINEVFGRIAGCFVYLDDISLVSPSWEQHVASVDQLLKTCQKFGITLSPKKCVFGTLEMDFLGFRVTQSGIDLMDKHRHTITNYPVPTNRKETKSFLGTATFNAHLVQNASVILEPLHAATSPKVPFQWTENCQRAFELFKRTIATAVGLAHRDESAPLYLCTDASLKKGAAVLYQLRDQSKFESLGFFSTVFSNAEQKLSSRHRELLAICYGVRHFRYSLLGANFFVVTDHKSLIDIFSAKSKSEMSLKVLNSLIYLTQYQFKVIHKPGTDEMISVSDALSRTPISPSDLEESQARPDLPDKIFHLRFCPGSSAALESTQELFTTTLAETLGINVITRARQKQMDTSISQPTSTEEPKSPIIAPPLNQQKNTPDILFRFGAREIDAPKLAELQNEDPCCRDIHAKILLNAKATIKKFTINNGCLMNTSHAHPRFVLPAILAKEYLIYLHTVIGHAGQNRMMTMANRHVWSKNLNGLATFVVNSCADCIRAKPAKTSRPVPAPPRHFDNEPWTKVYIDLWDAGRCDRKGKRFLLGITDELTSYVDAVVLPSKHEAKVAEGLLQLIFRHGIFRAHIVSDNGREWSSIWAKVTESLKIRHIRSSPYHSRSNGKIERSFRNLNVLLRTLQIDVNQWSEHIPYLLFLQNNSPKKILSGLTPSECLYGRSLNLPFESDTGKIDLDVPFTTAINKYLQQIHPILMERHYARYAKTLRQTPDGLRLSLGDRCFAYKPCIDNGKLSTSYSGPMVVQKIIGANTYELRDELTRRIFIRNIRHLRRLLPRDEITFETIHEV